MVLYRTVFFTKEPLKNHLFKSVNKGGAICQKHNIKNIISRHLKAFSRYTICIIQGSLYRQRVLQSAGECVIMVLHRAEARRVG